MTTRHTRQPAAAVGRLADPWDGGVIGWIVVFGAVIAEIIVGTVTNRMPMVIAAPALALPVAVVAGFALLQWLQARATAAAPASWWHLGGIAVAIFIWLAYPTLPGVLESAGNAPQACSAMDQPATSDCLQRAAQAIDNHNLAWWLTGVVILGAALLARRSRIAAWGAMPAAAAGCLLATHFLELLLRYYHAGG